MLAVMVLPWHSESVTTVFIDMNVIINLKNITLILLDSRQQYMQKQELEFL